MLAQKTAMVVVLAAAMSGCGSLLSLHPLYTDEDLIFEPGLAGTWTSKDGDRWIFEPAKDKAYNLKITDKDGETLVFETHLVRLGSFLFLDVEAPEADDPLISGHIFAKVALDGATLRIATMDTDWLKQQISQSIFIAHERLQSGKRKGQIVLTASTLDLQLFVLRLAGEPKAFDDEVQLSK